jgi:hypothetical protein
LLEETKKKYTDQVNINTDMRKKLNTLYVNIMSKKYRLPPETEEVLIKSINDISEAGASSATV